MLIVVQFVQAKVILNMDNIRKFKDINVKFVIKLFQNLQIQ